jgi:hypothetical protein
MSAVPEHTANCELAALLSPTVATVAGDAGVVDGA